MAILPTGIATAQTQQAFQVTARIVAGCSVATAAGGQWGTIDFGTVSGAATGTVAADLSSAAGAGLTLRCTPGTTATVTADLGDHAASGQRRLAGPAGSTPIAYDLLLDGGATPWPAGGVPLAFAATVSQRTLAVRGRATLSRPMMGGTYTDTVRVTVSW